MFSFLLRYLTLLRNVASHYFELLLVPKWYLLTYLLEEVLTYFVFEILFAVDISVRYLPILLVGKYLSTLFLFCVS